MPMLRTAIPVAATLAILAFTVSTAAQTPPSPLLNEVEVRTLIASAEASDHARLSAHFAALADRYAADARRHTTMSRGFIGNPSRNLRTGLSAHCRRLAESNIESAEILRELAIYHQEIAGGASAAAPAAGARFEGGAGAPAPREEELTALAARASTPADHRVLEEYFLAEAKRYTAEAADHAARARAYRGSPRRSPGGTGMAAHCDRLASLARDAAKEAAAAAEMHGQEAASGR